MKKGLASWLFGFIIILSSFMVSCGEKDNSSKATKNNGNTCKITVRSDGNGLVSIKDYLQAENVNVLLGSRITVLANPLYNDFLGWYLNDSKEPVSMLQEFSFIVSSDVVLTAKFKPIEVLLPTPPDDWQYDAPEIHECNIMKVYVNKDNEIMVTAGKDEPITLTVDELGTLRELAKVFITANTPDGIKNDNYPELKSKKDTIIHLNEHGVECYYPAPYSNAVWNNKHVITLQTDRSTSYEVYFKVQEALYGAYNDLRDDFAKEVYGVKNPKEQLTHDELELCRRRYVNMISEATPIDIGKK
jgi:hypothetical protein